MDWLKDLKYWDTLDWFTAIFALAVAGIILFVSITIIDSAIPGETKILKAVVVGKQYAPYSSGVGTGISTDGKVSTVVVSRPEQHIVAVRYLNSDEIGEFRVNEKTYYSTDEGQIVDVRCKQGIILKNSTYCNYP